MESHDIYGQYTPNSVTCPLSLTNLQNYIKVDILTSLHPTHETETLFLYNSIKTVTHSLR